MENQYPKQSPGLQSLPPELLSTVFRYVPHGTLYQLAFVNKHINKLVVPVLYESFSQYGGDITQVRQYFQIAQRVPELAKHLCDITIQGSLEITHKQVRKCLRKIDQERWGQCLYLNDAQLGYNNFSYGSDLAILLLLSLDSKVRSIRALHPPNPIKRGHGLLLPIYLEPIRGILAAGGPLPPWTNTLSTLEISLRLLSWQWIAPLFRLPVLKKLVLEDAFDLDLVVEVKTNEKPSMETYVLSRSSSIEELDFGSCMVSYTTIANAVSACKSLGSLGHRCCFDEEGEDQLFEKLREHASTLHALKTCSWESAESQPTNGGVFAEFTALTELEVDCLDAVASILPPNLRRLVLFADAKDARSLVGRMTMLATKLSKRPEIDIKLYYVHFETGGPKDVSKLCRLPAIFAKVGLNLALHICPVVNNIWLDWYMQ